MNSKRIKKIKAIEKRVPQEWRDALMTEEYVAPDLRAEALNSLAEYEEVGETDTKDYKRLKNLFDAGYYNARQTVVNEEIAKQIEDFIDEELEKAIEAGELPKPKDDRELKEYVTKLHKHEQREQKRRLRDKQRAEASGS